ncbi:MAG: flagellar biosynthesis protein FlgJ [Geobacteraceae bacterium]|nr:flagellar biosynthesis protein FlgJ [Geobacteraceae bacterium]NTW80925.1 flagellar biosynthesis protein FlgJ [Geobacteraceae bacterium]
MDIKITAAAPDISESSADKARLLQRASSNGAAGLTEKQRQQARKVSQDFEGLLVGMMMKSMRATVGKDTLTGGGHGEDVYRSMLDQEYANASVKQGRGLGIAKIIEKDIIRQESRVVRRAVDTKE